MKKILRKIKEKLLYSGKIYLPFENFEYIGGPTTFMNNLKSFLDQKGYGYCTDPRFAGGIFFPISFDISVLTKIKSRGGKIIQRLDGVYYPSKHGNKYLELNRQFKQVYLKYADFVILQSEYSKKQCFEMFGKKPKEDYAVIVNGADKKIFYPSKKPLPISKEPIRFVTTGNFQNIEMLEPIIKALDIIYGKYDFELLIAGPITDRKSNKYKALFNKPYINYLGPKNLNEVADCLRSSHIFIYSQLNSSCPNSVIEAVSCGLPVVGFDSGAMSEILFFNRSLLAPVSKDIFQKYEDFDENKLANRIIYTVKNYKKFTKIARKNSKLYSFEKCGVQYIKVFDKILSRECYKK